MKWRAAINDTDYPVVVVVYFGIVYIFNRYMHWGERFTGNQKWKPVLDCLCY